MGGLQNSGAQRSPDNLSHLPTQELGAC